MRRKPVLIVSGILILVAYVASYVFVSRSSLALNRKYGIEAFYYTPPCRPDVFAQSQSLQQVHEIGKVVFYPVWRLDYALGGPAYVSGAPQIFKP